MPQLRHLLRCHAQLCTSGLLDRVILFQLVYRVWKAQTLTVSVKHTSHKVTLKVEGIKVSRCLLLT